MSVDCILLSCYKLENILLWLLDEPRREEAIFAIEMLYLLVSVSVTFTGTQESCFTGMLWCLLVTLCYTHAICCSAFFMYLPLDVKLISPLVRRKGDLWRYFMVSGKSIILADL